MKVGKLLTDHAEFRKLFHDRTNIAEVELCFNRTTNETYALITEQAPAMVTTNFNNRTTTSGFGLANIRLYIDLVGYDHETTVYLTQTQARVFVEMCKRFDVQMI